MRPVIEFPCWSSLNNKHHMSLARGGDFPGFWPGTTAQKCRCGKSPKRSHPSSADAQLCRSRTANGISAQYARDETGFA